MTWWLHGSYMVAARIRRRYDEGITNSSSILILDLERLLLRDIRLRDREDFLERLARERSRLDDRTRDLISSSLSNVF